MVPSTKLHYRPEIDGLRAIAVMAVLLFHGGSGCPGGYVGVDVFFVISGFLITSLIWNDLECGKFTLAHFWERRARRIVPAAVVVTVVTLAAGWFLLLPSDFQSLGRAAASQAVFAANIHYFLSSSYFSISASQKPLLHTWTLAVEEQFYFIIPFLLLGMYRSSMLRTRAAVTTVLASGFALSFALSVYGMGHDPSTAFYLLPMRAWELLLGSLVAFYPIPPSCLGRRRLREFFAMAGLALVLVPIFVYTSTTPFPGLAALPPCLGAALLIWANGRSDSLLPTISGRLLSARPAVLVGQMSYSLYLWHWPFMAFGNYLLPEPISPGYRATLLGLGVVTAYLSWKFVEAPFRTRKCGATRTSMFSFAGAGLATALAGGLLCMYAKGFPQRLSPQALAFANAASDRGFLNNLTAEDVLRGNLVKIGARNSSLQPAVIVWGDSHAMSALPAFDAYLKEVGVAGCAVTHSSTAPVLGWYLDSQYGLGKDSIAFNNAVASYIERRHIPHVILVGRWDTYVESDVNRSGRFEHSLLATVRHLVAIGAHPWVMLDVPIYPFNVPRVLSLPIYSDEYAASLQVKPGKCDSLAENDRTLIAKLKAAGATVLDPKPEFLDPQSRKYAFESAGVALYYDGQHLSTNGSKLILLPLLRDSLKLSPGRGNRVARSAMRD